MIQDSFNVQFCYKWKKIQIPGHNINGHPYNAGIDWKKVCFSMHADKN